MKKIIAIANQKGGVSKTTTAVNLGAALALNGKSVCLVDLDPQANASVYLNFDDEDAVTINDMMRSAVTGTRLDYSSGVRSSDNYIDFIPADINLSNAEFYLSQAVARESILKRVLSAHCFGGYDYIIIDCLPSLGILLMNALAAADEIIIPVQTQKFALQGLNGLTDVITQVQTMINSDLNILGILPTMADGTNMSRNTESKLRELYGDKVFAPIHRSVEAAYSAEHHKAMSLDEKSKLGNEYRQLAHDVIGICG